MNGRPVYCNGGRTQWLILKRSQKREHVVGHGAKKTYPSSAEEKHFTVYSKRPSMFTTTKVNKVLSEIHVSSEKKCHVVLFTFTQTLYYHLWLLMWQTGWLSDVFFLSKKMMIQGHRECSCLWFLIVRIPSNTWGNRHLLFMADGAWVPWTEPMNLMAVQSVWPPGMHFWNIYKTLQLMGSFTYLSTGAGFLSVKSTASHLAIARFSHTSLTNQYRISQMWCQGDQGRSKQWRRSLRLKLKTSWWKSSFVSKKRQLPVSCASLFIESFFFQKGKGRAFFWLRCMPMWRPMGCVIRNSCNEVWKLWDACHQDPAEEPFGVLRSWQVGVEKIRKNFWKPRSAWRSPLHQIWQFHIFTTHDLQCWFAMMWHDV